MTVMSVPPIKIILLVFVKFRIKMFSSPKVPPWDVLDSLFVQASVLFSDHGRKQYFPPLALGLCTFTDMATHHDHTYWYSNAHTHSSLCHSIASCCSLCSFKGSDPAAALQVPRRLLSYVSLMYFSWCCCWLFLFSLSPLWVNWSMG